MCLSRFKSYLTHQSAWLLVDIRGVEMLLTDKAICALSELAVEEEYPPTLDHHRNIARLQLKEVVEWGEEDCTEHAVESRKPIRRSLEMMGRSPVYPRHECYACWQNLLKEVGL